MMPIIPTTPTANTKIPAPIKSHVIISTTGSLFPTLTACPRLESSGSALIHMPTPKIAIPKAYKIEIITVKLKLLVGIAMDGST